MSEISALKAEVLHDRVVKKAAQTVFRKYKVVTNTKTNRVVSIGVVYPDLVAYDVYSVKPFLASETPTLISQVEVEAVATDELVAKWAELEPLDVDRIVLILPKEMKNRAEEALKKLGAKFELRFFDEDLNIS
jgi:hypothetical protein